MKYAKDLKIPFTWEERRPVFIDSFFYVPASSDREGAFEGMFPLSGSVRVEFCSGNGQWICEKARFFPKIQWIAIEKDFVRARKIWLHLHRESLSNLIVVCSEGLRFSQIYLPDQSIEQIYLNFPDPWPKRRHAKHRLFNPPFFQEMFRILQQGGKGMLVTDDAPTMEQTLGILAKDPHWQLAPAPHYLTEFPEYGFSYFSSLWKQKGRQIRYIPFTKDPQCI